MLGEEGFQGVAQVFEEVPAIGNLGGVRCSYRRAEHVLFAAIAADDLDTWMLLQPANQTRRGRIVEQLDGTVPLKIDQNCPIAPPLPLGPIVHPDDADIAVPEGGMGTHQTEQGSRTGWELKDTGQPSACFSTKCKANGGEDIGNGHRLPSPNADDGRQAFTEDTPGAVSVATAEATHMEAEQDCSSAAGEVVDSAAVVAMQVTRSVGTERTAGGTSARNQIDEGAVVARLDREHTE